MMIADPIASLLEVTPMPRHPTYVPHGVIPAVLLPFHDDLSIDEAGFRQHLREVAAVEGLFAFHKLESKFNFAGLARAVEAADRARDALAHSVYMHDVNVREGRVHLVRGSWALAQPDESVASDRWPEAPALDRALLAQLRDDVEAAVARAQKLRDTTDRLLRKLHDARRTNPRLDRRRSR